MVQHEAGVVARIAEMGALEIDAHQARARYEQVLGAPIAMHHGDLPPRRGGDPFLDAPGETRVPHGDRTVVGLGTQLIERCPIGEGFPERGLAPRPANDQAERSPDLARGGSRAVAAKQLRLPIPALRRCGEHRVQETRLVDKERRGQASGRQRPGQCLQNFPLAVNPRPLR